MCRIGKLVISLTGGVKQMVHLAGRSRSGQDKAGQLLETNNRR